MERNVCWYYNTKNGCRNGDFCSFRHTKMEKSSMPKCRYYRGPDTCLYEDQCFFRHDNDSSSNPPESSTGGPKIENINATSVKAKTVKDNCIGMLEAGGEMAGAVGGSSDGKQKNIQRKSPKNKEKYLSVKLNNKVKDDSTPIKSAKQKIVSEGGDRNNNAVEDLGEGVEEIDTNKENKTIMCGECGIVLKDVDPPSNEDDSFQDELEKHYKEMFLKLDKSHLSFLDKDPRFKLPTSCGVCGRDFVRVKSLLAHITDKVKSKKNDWKMHDEFLEAFLMAFWERDLGLSDEKEMLDSLLLHLVESYEGEDSDLDSDDDSDTDGINALFGLMALGKILQEGGLHVGPGYHDDDDSGDSCTFGMDDDDIYELACQGIKPWDPEVHDALAILNGEDDYY